MLKRIHFDVYCRLADQLSPCNSSDEGDSEIDSINDDLSSNVSNTSGSKRQKRGILPKQATSVMRAWLFQHLVVRSYSAILFVRQYTLHPFILSWYQATLYSNCFIFLLYSLLCFWWIAPLSNRGRKTSNCRSNESNIVAGLTPRTTRFIHIYPPVYIYILKTMGFLFCFFRFLLIFR